MSDVRFWQSLLPNVFADTVKLALIALSAGAFELLSVVSIVAITVHFLGGDTALVPAVLSTFVAWISSALNVTSDAAAGILFVSSIVTASVAKVCNIVVLSGLTAKLSLELSERVADNLLEADYSEVAEISTSNLASAISNKINAFVYWVITPIFNVFFALVSIVAILTALLLVSEQGALIALLAIGLIYLVFGISVRHRVRALGSVVAENQDSAIRALREIRGHLIEIKLFNIGHILKARFMDYERSVRLADAKMKIIGEIPRPIIEMLGIVLICVYAVYSVIGTGVPPEQVFPFLAAVVLGAQRALPLVQVLFNAYNNLNAAQQSLRDLRSLMRSIRPGALGDNDFRVAKGLHFQRLQYQDLRYSYGNSQNPIFEGLSVVLEAGKWYRLTGSSGAGKSTLVEILSGLRRPSDGRVSINDVRVPRYWDELQGFFSICPQDVFLSEESILNNITLGVEVNDPSYLDDILEITGLSQIFSYDERHAALSENAGNLSGGQRQRVGIARALYHCAPVLILDESTSAIDAMSESAILQRLKTKMPLLTVILISHGSSIGRFCDYEIRL